MIQTGRLGTVEKTKIADVHPRTDLRMETRHVMMMTGTKAEAKKGRHTDDRSENHPVVLQEDLGTAAADRPVDVT